MPKIPYFPFYPADWVSSQKIRLMSWEQRGIYIHLLSEAWLHPGCMIPTSRELLQKLCPGARWKNIEYVVREAFEPIGEGHANPRLRVERSKAIAKHQRISDASKIRESIKKGSRIVAESCQDRGTTQNQNQNQNQKEHKYIYGEYKHVRLTTDQYQKLQERFKEKTEEWIRKLDEGIETKGYKYKNHYLAILKWEKNDGLQGGGGRGQRESERDRALREGKELARKAFGYGRTSPRLSHDVHPGETQPGSGEGLDSKVINSTAVEVDETG